MERDAVERHALVRRLVDRGRLVGHALVGHALVGHPLERDALELIGLDASGAPVDQVASPDDRRATWRVVALAAALAGAASALLLICDCVDESLRASPWWTAVLLAVAFGVAERFVFEIEYRRNAITFSLSEAPTIFAIAFLAPPVAIAARVVGSTVAIVTSSRPARYKVAFNAALFGFETAFAAWAVRLMVTHESSDAALVLALVAAVPVATLGGSLAVSTAIAQFEGQLLARIAGELRTSVFTAPLAAVVGVVALAPALIDWRLGAFSMIPVVAVWAVLLRHGRLTQAHHDLRDLHAFSAVVNRALSLHQLLPEALGEIMRLVRAESGRIEVIGEDGASLTHTAGRDLAHGPDHESATITLAIEDAAGAMGTIVLADRAGSASAFSDEDRDRTRRLVDQLAAAMRNGLLHAGIEHAAAHDALTGLLNRPGFEQRVTRALGDERPGCHAILMLDLDRFKEINDTLGHAAGDRVLAVVSERLRAALEPGDVVARFGGDEFAAYLYRDDIVGVRDAAERVLFESHAPIAVDDAIAVTTVSIGIATTAESSRDLTMLLRHADVAMYAAKREHAGVEVYRTEIDRRTPERLSLLADLRAALDGDELAVHYQPKLDIRTGTVIGAEALVRWHHPRRGWVSPMDFIPLAEETGLIRLVTDRVFEVALTDVAEWARHGYDLDVSVNVSTLDLHDELLTDRVLHRLATHAVSPSSVVIEVTETALMSDAPRVLAGIHRLHDAGIALSLDDFGTGYSSLSYLRRLPVSELKIDRSFIANMLLDEQDDTIVRSTIELGHNLGLTVVAEGIESEPVLMRLRGLGCDTAQGYGISRPLDPALLLRWMETTAFTPRRAHDARRR